MGPQIQNVSQHKVRHGTTLDANVSLFHFFLELWVVSEVEPVSNSFGSEDDCIVKLLIVAGVALAAVEVDVELASH